MNVPTGSNTFELCQKEECFEGEEFSTFGGTGSYNETKPDINQKNHYIMEVDITDLVKKQGWTGQEESLVARMKTSVVENLDLPEPVIIVEPKVKGGYVKGRVILNPEEEQSHYGNLLDEYSAVEAQTKGETPKKVKIKNIARGTGY